MCSQFLYNFTIAKPHNIMLNLFKFYELFEKLKEN
jgi:hypothetical protein